MSTRATRIAVLPELLKNQIAAGEVIERPASAVKELVENALDAGATRIQVDLEEGGVNLVRVSDDGIGMGAEDLALAFASHATSKLSAVADLDHIATLGFRGEALASIGSVARARIVSCERGATFGAEVRDEGGAISPVREAGAAEGTIVEVRDLFYNTPARRRFLKSTATELARALDVVQRLALASEGVGFVVTHDGRRVFDVEPRMTLVERVRRTFGAELAEALAPVEARDGTTRLSGFVAPPRFARHDASRQMWFLNGRPLRDKLLSRVLKDAYRGFVVDNRQAVAFLALSVDPALVDVNVHPAKAEVRFRDERRLFGFLVHHLREAVAGTDMSTPGARLLETVERRESREGSSAWLAFERSTPGSSATSPTVAFGAALGTDLVRERAAAPFASPGGRFDEPPARAAATSSDTAAEAAGAGDDSLASGLPLMQVARTFIVRALADGFEVLDQHALHERIQFEGLRRELERGAIEAQRLLVPEVLDASRHEVALVGEHREALERLGILVEPFGPSSIAIHGLPARLKRARPAELVRDVIAAIEEHGGAPTGERVLQDLLHRAACRSSVMAGDALTLEEMRALLLQGAGLASDQTCVHGRPTRVRFTLADLEKAFHRR